MDTVSTQIVFGGTQGVYNHTSAACGGTMRFSVFTPPQAKSGPVPVVWWLSGLTCTHANFTEKAGAQRAAAELGLMIIAPDTSPRGDDTPDVADAYDLGLGAGFYLNATQQPWANRYNMARYVTEELPALIAAEFPADMSRQAISGHSMGGHGALTLHLKHPDIYRSATAFAPIVAPSQVPWGRKAFALYLGDDEATWADYDATRLLERSPSEAHILIDQGEADPFLAEQLKPELFEDAARKAGQSLTLRRHSGYDHFYYFIATFIEEHLRWHAERL